MTGPGNHDIAIVGAGPAGLALAGAARRAGMDVVLVDPSPRRAWTQTWCGFDDELPADIPVQHRWDAIRVLLPSGEVRHDRGYVLVDSAALQARLWEAASDVRVCATRVRGVGDHLLVTDDGELRARYLVDCSGGAQALGRRGPAPTAFQTAWGVEIDAPGHPWPVGVATWMDLTGMQAQPSFLYALPIDEGRVFVEETALAARPALPIDHLRARLDARLQALGVAAGRIHRTERCVIPLDVPAPAGLAFGTAAGMVHPATGYLLARVLSRADAYAEALRDDRPQRAMRVARTATLPLHRLGLDVLTRCDGDELALFFERFFAQPRWVTDAFLSRDAPLVPTVMSMSRIFATAGQARRLLLRPLLSTSPLETPCPTR